MTLKQAKAIVKAKFPHATCHYNARLNDFLIRETRWSLSPTIGTDIGSACPVTAWKEAATKISSEEASNA